MEKSSIAAIVRTLNDANIHYLIAGELAAVAHRYVRLTADLDLILDLRVPSTKSGNRQTMNDKHHDSDDQWPGGWEAHRLAPLRRLAKLTLSEKLDWLEQAHRVASHLAKADSIRAERPKA
jgi:hypothetical protein